MNFPLHNSLISLFDDVKRGNSSMEPRLKLVVVGIQPSCLVEGELIGEPEFLLRGDFCMI